jgi:hypothetical protein
MKPLKALNVLFGLAFVLAASVQLNDPDPVRWVLVYLSAAALTVLFHVGRMDWRTSAALSAITVVWASTLIPTVIAHPPPLSEVFGDVKMYAPGVEEAREAGGLLLVSVWVGALTLAVRRSRS